MRYSFLLIFFISYNVNAGRVVAVRGMVYAQLNGHLEMNLLKKGEEVDFNTLITTSSKSFIRIKFPNESVFTVGPKSKVMLTQKNPEAPKILNLIIGKVRGQVKKNHSTPKDHQHKLYIKTRSAVLGVRGTEFVVSYNDKNHNTSSITIRGEVDIYKKKDEEIMESIRSNDIDEDTSEIVGYDETNDLKDQLAGYDVKRIKKGSFSSAKFNHDKPLDPVRVSPSQIETLKNSNFTGKKELNNKRQEKEINSIKTLNRYRVDRETSEGYRHGGIVDLGTGLYVSPPINAKFNKDQGVYEMPKQLGKVNPRTGDYSPPMGIILDPTAGFTVDPLYYGDRKILENLKSLTKLAGPIDKQLEQAVRIFKHITRSDFYGFGDFKHTSRVLENYYGEYRNVTDNPAFFYEAQAFGGSQLYHSKKYLIYLKGNVKAQYFDSDEKFVQRNNTYEGMGGLEFSRKISIYGKKAKVVFDTEYRKQYMNREMNDNYLPYTEDVLFRVKNIFSFNRKNHSNLYFQIKYFQGYDEMNHGKIHDLGFNHRFIWGKEYDLLTGADYSVRNDHQDEQFFRISRVYLKGVKKNIFHKTNLTFGLTHEWHESDIKFPFAKTIFKRAELNFNRRLGNFWKLNANYKYEDQEAENDKDSRNFNRHVFGLGLTMYY